MRSSNGFVKMENNSTCFYDDGNDPVKQEKSVTQEGGYHIGTVIGWDLVHKWNHLY